MVFHFFRGLVIPNWEVVFMERVELGKWVLSSKIWNRGSNNQSLGMVGSAKVDYSVLLFILGKE